MYPNSSVSLGNPDHHRPHPLPHLEASPPPTHPRQASGVVFNTFLPPRTLPFLISAKSHQLDFPGVLRTCPLLSTRTVTTSARALISLLPMVTFYPMKPPPRRPAVHLVTSLLITFLPWLPTTHRAGSKQLRDSLALCGCDPAFPSSPREQGTSHHCSPARPPPRSGGPPHRPAHPLHRLPGPTPPSLGLDSVFRLI